MRRGARATARAGDGNMPAATEAHVHGAILSNRIIGRLICPILIDQTTDSVRTRKCGRIICQSNDWAIRQRAYIVLPGYPKLAEKWSPGKQAYSPDQQTDLFPGACLVRPLLLNY